MIISMKTILSYGVCGLLGGLLTATINAVPQPCNIQCTPSMACSTTCWSGETVISCHDYGTCYIPPPPPPSKNPSNRCVEDVPAEITSLAGTVGHVYRYRKPSSSDPDGILSWFNYIAGKNNTVCHVQGLVRLTTGNDNDDKFKRDGGKEFFIYNANIIGGQQWFVSPFNTCTTYPNFDSFGPMLQSYSPNYGRFRWLNFWLAGNTDPDGTPQQNWHSGGMQAIGTYVVVGTDNGPGDSYISILDASSKTKPVFVNSFYNDQTRAEAVAVGRRQDGRYLILAGAKQGEKIAVFLSSSTNIETSSWSPVLVSDASITSGYWWPGKYPSEKDSNFNNYAFIQQCDGELFLAGLTNSDYTLGGTSDFDDTSHIHLYKLSWVGNSPRFTKAMTNRLEMDNPCNCFLCFDVCPNWAAGGTLFVNSDGKIGGYATEHWPDGGDLDILAWDPFKQRTFRRR